MRRNRHAKIVATLGPASSSPDMIRALFEAGADVFRFNFSHGSHQEHQKRYDIVRAIEQETGRPIAVLADLQGPKLSGRQEIGESRRWLPSTSPVPIFTASGTTRSSPATVQRQRLIPDKPLGVSTRKCALCTPDENGP